METIKDLVSVVVPIYNTPEILLRKCIESIINQTYTNLELFLVDDGSTNNALEVCKTFATDNIYVIHQENQGVSVARNVGIKNAKGKWITFVDPDDYLEPNAIDIFVSNATESDDIVASCCKLENKDSVSITHFFDGNKCFDADKYELYQQLLWEITNGCAPWGKIFRRDCIIQNKILFDPALRRAQDIVFNLYASYHCNRYKYIDLPLYVYNNEHMSNYHNDYKPELANYYLLFAKARFQWMITTNSFNDKILTRYYENGAYSILNQILSVGAFHKKNGLSFKEKAQAAEKYFVEECFAVIMKEKIFLQDKNVSIKDKIKRFILKNKLWRLYSLLKKYQDR